MATAQLPRLIPNLPPREFFAKDGPLSRHFKGYAPRESQIQMAENVYARFKGITAPYPVAIEAPTGTGKSLAYLVGALLADAAVVVTTANKALQEQIVTKDLPLLRAIWQEMGWGTSEGLRFARVMGKSNYGCRFRVHEENPPVPQVLTDWLFENTTRKDEFGEYTEAAHGGNRYEVPESLADVASRWWSDIAADETCQGRNCPLQRQCGYLRERLDLHTCDVLVGNHHLLAIDLLTSWRGIMIPPKFGFRGSARSIALILDEAHKWPEILASQTSEDLRLSLFERMDDDDITRHANVLFNALANRFSAQQAPGKPINPNAQMVLGDGADMPSPDALRVALEDWADRVWPPGDVPETTGERRLQIKADRARALAETLELVFRKEVAYGYTRVITIGSNKEQKELHAPLARRIDLKYICWKVDTLSRTLWGGYRPGANGNSAPASAFSIPPSAALKAAEDTSAVEPGESNIGAPWIPVFTSATLSFDKKMDTYLGDVGFHKVADQVILPPVFDYRNNARLFVPTMMPADPHSPEYQKAAGEIIYQLACATNGRMLVLVTSYNKLGQIADSLERQLPRNMPWRVLRQDYGFSNELLTEFKQRKGDYSILLGTATFWEGIDLPGDQLMQVVIAGLPFTPPDDAVFKARVAHVQKLTGNPKAGFMEVAMPDMTLRILQGYGRLIRRMTDRGVVTLLDSRVTDRPWGGKIIRSLPPAPLTRNIADVHAMFAGQFAPSMQVADMV